MAAMFVSSGEALRQLQQLQIQRRSATGNFAQRGQRNRTPTQPDQDAGVRGEETFNRSGPEARRQHAVIYAGSAAALDMTKPGDAQVNFELLLVITEVM